MMGCAFRQHFILVFFLSISFLQGSLVPAHYLWRTAVCLAFAFVVGCGNAGGPPLFSVTGKLTKGGKPMAGVNVTFSPVNNGPSSTGRTNDEGRFVLVSQNGKAGAVAGKHKVVLSIPAVLTSSIVNMADPAYRDKMIAEREASQKAGAKGKPASTEDTKTIPAEYNNPQKTPLEYEVPQRSIDFDIPLP